MIGGENIYPVEIEARLAEHACISRAAVVGIRDERYGEVVGAFLLAADSNINTSRENRFTAKHLPEDSAAVNKKLGDEEIRNWTRVDLGRHKAPTHIFWLGEEGLGLEIPQTGSGKVKKHVLRELGEKIVRDRERSSGKQIGVIAKL
jgi:acyl-CoA synthetase (AMP-forming)/AMP-acid ligase II